MKILGSGEKFDFAFAICIFLILHFAFKFPAKNSEFFRFKCLNFPPKNLDSIGGGGHCDNSGRPTSSVKPILDLEMFLVI